MRAADRSETWVAPTPDSRSSPREEIDAFSATLLTGVELRSYQREGANWLLWSALNRRSVILGDEMGLGKTMQVVATLQHMASVWRCPGPFLVVVPLSTIPHWERELGRGSELHPLLLSGSAADRRALLQASLSGSGSRAWNVLLITYETLLSESRKLHGVGWRAVVLDEAQRLKNPRSKSFTAAATLRTDQRILLSGTPLQNSVAELWALLHLLSPTAFADEAGFCRRFGTLETARQAAALSELARPYLLRRTKADVEASLSRLTERLIHVEFTAFQKAIYRAVCEKNRALLVGGEGEAGRRKEAPSFRNLEMLLRHVCNHPYLVQGVEAEAEEQLGGYASNKAELDALVSASGKTVLLAKLLPHLQEHGHRVLVFSQFKEVLNLLEDVLDHLGLEYERLDGDITGAARQAAIARFEAPGCTTPVFLLGTRAGGLGITLTSADTVILFDPDWNPQADLQAAARCHRIGQHKPVTVYRLVSRGTYEAALYARANQKRGLEQAVIGHGDFGGRGGSRRPGGAGVSDAEIERLLRMGAQVLGPGTSGDDASTRFASSSIDQLLATHAETIERDEGAAAAGGAFSQATFVSQEAAGAPDLDDPDFWQKVLPEAENGRGTQAAQHGEEGRTLRQRSGGSGWPARAEPPGSDTDDSDGLDDEEEEEGQALTGKASCPRPWRPAELRLLCASLLRGGLARVHTLVGDELQSRTAAEVHCAAEAVVALWLEGQPAAAPHRFTREQLGTAPDGPLLGVAPSLDGPVESAAPNESIPRAAPSPHGRKVRDAPPIVPGASAAADGHTAPVAPGFPANFVQKQSSVKASARGLQCLRSIAAVEEHVTAGRGVGSLRLRKRSVVAGWTADHDEALVAAAHRRGFPSARRPADDLAYWRAIAGLVQSAAPPLPGLCVAGSCAASGPGAETDGDAEPGEDGEAGEGDVPAICGSLNARLVQLCRAMLSFTHEQARDVQKEAEARERRRAEIEEKRRVRAEVEAARAAARELRQAERAAQAAVKAEAARARETARKERRAEREVEDAKSAEQKKDEKRAREAERVSSLLEQGKKVWADSREVQDLAGHRSYPPVPPTTAGKPQERNRSCHLCTQGVASWRGAFTAPLGCSRCPRIFCERCLGHINDEAVLPLAGRSVPAFLDQRWDDWVCLMCAGKCACQDEALAAKVQIASVCATSGGMCRVCTVGAHGFRAGDSVIISGVKLADSSGGAELSDPSQVAKEALARLNKQHGKVASSSRSEFEVHVDMSGLPVLASGTGRAYLPTIEMHKRRGWVGVTGSGVSKKSPGCGLAARKATQPVTAHKAPAKANPPPAPSASAAGAKRPAAGAGAANGKANKQPRTAPGPHKVAQPPQARGKTTQPRHAVKPATAQPGPTPGGGPRQVAKARAAAGRPDGSGQQAAIDAVFSGRKPRREPTAHGKPSLDKQAPGHDAEQSDHGAEATAHRKRGAPRAASSNVPGLTADGAPVPRKQKRG